MNVEFHVLIYMITDVNGINTPLCTDVISMTQPLPFWKGLVSFLSWPLKVVSPKFLSVQLIRSEIGL